jgi:shikimate kinase
MIIMMPDGNIILAGPMGSGKTCVGEAVAKMLGREFRDTDKMIEEITGLSIVRIFSERSEAYFRNLEREVAKIISRETNLVVAVGGGMTVSDENFDVLCSSGIMICLCAREKELLLRLKDSEGRPMLRGADLKTRLHQILEDRKDSYDRIPFRIDTDNLDVESVAAQVVELYEEQVAHA